MDDGRERLARMVRERRIDLRMSVSAAARAAGIHRATWTGMEDGTRQTEEYNYGSIERALRWGAGSINAVLAGGEPVIRNRVQAVLPGRVDPLPPQVVADIEMIYGLDLPPATRLAMIRRVVDLHRQAQDDAQADRPEAPARRRST